jgi:hypothetical protein
MNKQFKKIGPKPEETESEEALESAATDEADQPQDAQRP